MVTMLRLAIRRLSLGCVRLLKEDLDRRGVVSKRRTSRSGVASGGRSFNFDYLAGLPERLPGEDRRSYIPVKKIIFPYTAVSAHSPQ
jgi:hypothetical protein